MFGSAKRFKEIVEAGVKAELEAREAEAEAKRHAAEEYQKLPAFGSVKMCVKCGAQRPKTGQVVKIHHGLCGAYVYTSNAILYQRSSMFFERMVIACACGNSWYEAPKDRKSEEVKG